MGAVIILLLWFNLSSYAVLLGAELNAEMEHQTARDTTKAWSGLLVSGEHMSPIR